MVTTLATRHSCRITHSGRDLAGVVGGDLAPFVRGALSLTTVARMPERQAKLVRRTETAPAGSAAFLDPDESKLFEFAKRHVDHTTWPHSVLDEVRMRDRQRAVVLAAVLGGLDLNPVERTMSPAS